MLGGKTNSTILEGPDTFAAQQEVAVRRRERVFFLKILGYLDQKFPAGSPG
jgi:hypothetical protein